MGDETSDSVTSVSLLVQLQRDPADQNAWSEFVRLYGARIQGWGRRWGLQDADAHDMSQDVLVKLTRAMRAFRYDPAQSFRGWLKTVAHHTWQDLARVRRPIARGGDPPADDPLLSLAARDDLAAGVAAAYEQELLERALDRVRQRVQTQTWDAFRLTTYDGVSGPTQRLVWVWR
jgi:DNA-directed RNA polymerase specialized sigma24 family protein